MYKKISDYGIIGNMHSVALVSSDGSIDYCSMPHIDSPTVFASLLDDKKGGFFQIRPKGKFNFSQRYLKDTNILETTFKTNQAKARLNDFMAVSNQDKYPSRTHLIHRCLKIVKGRMDFSLICIPRLIYASKIPTIEKKENFFLIKKGKEEFTLIVKAKNIKIKRKDEGKIKIEFSLSNQESAHFDFTYGKVMPDELQFCSFKDTKLFWQKWLTDCVAGKCQVLGKYQQNINRSLLVLKLLTFKPTGAISAAATTSLPEALGGTRNWDYRFTWLRDASFTLRALFSLGHIKEAESFIAWLHDIYKKYGSKKLQIMYSLEGENELKEKELNYLKGYKESKPVRVGNLAYNQNQWDIYGEVLDVALRLSNYAGKIDENLWPFFKNICNLASQNWQKPDDGVWEVRNGPFHFVYSKVMCWVALDRGLKIAKRYGFDAPWQNWQQEKKRIKEDVLEKGYNEELGSFTQHYGSNNVDVSLLLLPLVGFLSVKDKRMKKTIFTCQEKLSKEGFLFRYSGADGLEGEEGSFILCNFWLIECLILLGKMDQAKKVLSQTAKASNHLGLFSEEYDSKNKQMLGNFPQAFSHIGYINAVSSLLNKQLAKANKKRKSSLKQKIKKIIPYRVVLNSAEEEAKKTDEKIASRLKSTLGQLQGAFFNVAEGRVNYRALKESKSYANYLKLAAQLGNFNPANLKSDQAKKSFWINIYNILIIHGVIEFDVQSSVKEVFRFFSRIEYKIGNFYFSADDIEHGILRANQFLPGSKKRQFSKSDKRIKFKIEKLDPRIHFALVCAASSCPPIEFYDSEKIDTQLNIAAKSFINRRGLILNKKKKTVTLSQIFKWYLDDFGKSKKESLQFALKFTENKQKEYIENNFQNLKINYLPYNWDLNSTLK